MTKTQRIATSARDIEGQVGTSYPEEFTKDVAARTKWALGDVFELTDYGVNLVDLSPGAWSSQRHWHTHEDEFVYILAGELTLVTDTGEEILTAGMIAGFKAGAENGHHLINLGESTASYLEIGTRAREDEVFYPDIDLRLVSDGKGGREFTHRDGSPYD